MTWRLYASERRGYESKGCMSLGIPFLDRGRELYERTNAASARENRPTSPRKERIIMHVGMYCRRSMRMRRGWRSAMGLIQGASWRTCINLVLRIFAETASQAHEAETSMASSKDKLSLEFEEPVLEYLARRYVLSWLKSCCLSVRSHIWINLVHSITIAC